VNVKVFNNGGVQMTGAKTVDQGRLVLSFVVRLAQGLAALVEPSALPHGYRVCLINSDFRLGFEIRRDRLHGLFLRRYPHLNATFDPCSYPGVVIRYKWKASRPPEVPEGACSCGVAEEARGSSRRCCNGKGDGHDAAGACRSITVIMFASGNVIITGARSYDQLRAVHEYVNRIVLRHRKVVERAPVVAVAAPPPSLLPAGAEGEKEEAKEQHQERKQESELSSLLLLERRERHGNKNLLSFLSKARVRTVSA
jgi:TATA-box binding protein (TBP) (component of TFIID and TFIIIB)